MSARFTHAIIRLRGATDAETARWLHALRASAGLAPLGYASSPAFAAAIAEPAAAAAAPDAPQFSAAYESTIIAAAAAAPRPATDTGATAATGDSAAPSDQPELPPLGILDEYVNAELTTPALTLTTLTTLITSTLTTLTTSTLTTRPSPPSSLSPRSPSPLQVRQCRPHDVAALLLLVPVGAA